MDTNDLPDNPRARALRSVRWRARVLADAIERQAYDADYDGFPARGARQIPRVGYWLARIDPGEATADVIDWQLPYTSSVYPRLFYARALHVLANDR